jgi:chromosome segregation ATPase
MHARFLSANEELRDFLRRVEHLTNGNGTVSEDDLQQISQRLLNLAPEIGDASRSETLDTGLELEIAEYVKNLRALQGALERVRSLMRARRAQLESAKGHKNGLQSWVNAYHETTH